MMSTVKSKSNSTLGRFSDRVLWRIRDDSAFKRYDADYDAEMNMAYSGVKFSSYLRSHGISVAKAFP